MLDRLNFTSLEEREQLAGCGDMLIFEATQCRTSRQPPTVRPDRHFEIESPVQPRISDPAIHFGSDAIQESEAIRQSEHEFYYNPLIAISLKTSHHHLRDHVEINICQPQLRLIRFPPAPQHSHLMKSRVFPHMVALLLLSSIASLSAQNLASTSHSSDISSSADDADGTSEARFRERAAVTGEYEVPTTQKAQGLFSDGGSVYAAQDSLTLKPQASHAKNVESVVDLGILRNPSPYRKVATSTSGVPYEVSADTLQTGLALISAVYRESATSEKGTDCLVVVLSVEQRIKLDVSQVLEVVASEVGANPSCACEIVKTAIKVSDADVALVAAIVETSITAAPDCMRIVSQCAIATLPESVAAVQALLARLDPNSGNAEVYSSKSAKSAKSAKVVVAVETLPNPLDRPYFPPIYPLPVSNVNPGNR